MVVKPIWACIKYIFSIDPPNLVKVSVWRNGTNSLLCEQVEWRQNNSGRQAGRGPAEGCERRGDLMVSALDSTLFSAPDRDVRVRALPGDIALCSLYSRHQGEQMGTGEFNTRGSPAMD